MSSVASGTDETGIGRKHQLRMDLESMLQSLDSIFRKVTSLSMILSQEPQYFCIKDYFDSCVETGLKSKLCSEAIVIKQVKDDGDLN